MCGAAVSGGFLTRCVVTVIVKYALEKKQGKKSRQCPLDGVIQRAGFRCGVRNHVQEGDTEHQASHEAESDLQSSVRETQPTGDRAADQRYNQHYGTVTDKCDRVHYGGDCAMITAQTTARFAWLRDRLGSICLLQNCFELPASHSRLQFRAHHTGRVFLTRRANAEKLEFMVQLGVALRSGDFALQYSD